MGAALIKKPRIEWRHVEEGGEVRDRCSRTGASLEEAVEEVRRELGPGGLDVTFEEVLLEKEDVSRSNEILFNGVALEEVLPRITVYENACPSCSGLLREETCCRTVECGGEVYEEVPAALIRRAARKAAGIRTGDPGGFRR